MRKIASLIAEPVMLAKTIKKNIENKRNTGCFSAGLMLNKDFIMISKLE
tara:strand:+ start:386 stop:532 length:147 start_codon:yes stop_codon:yes gene_type:complete